MIQIPDFADKTQLFNWLKKNKTLLIAEKKSMIKHADAVSFYPFEVSERGTVVKAAANPELMNMDEFAVDVVINTTYIRDSHKDVHIDGLWKKSLTELKLIYHMQEHEMRYEKVISDRVTAKTVKMSWADLGEKYEGQTEALVFHSIIEKDRNPYMAEQYAKGRVRNHSVGMQYMKLDLALNSEYKGDAEEKVVWDKYIGKIANREEVEEDGYFWAVTEAKLIEGSSVLIGSNQVTPTISISPKALDTAGETTEPKPLDWASLTKAFKQNN